jgi:hypothetical protein
MKFQREQMIAQIRKEAKAAWVAKDFARVAELFQPVRDHLIPIDIKKLAYAEKHLGLRIHTSSKNLKVAGAGSFSQSRETSTRKSSRLNLSRSVSDGFLLPRRRGS